ncbi:MAG: 4'-phosphopantetheinyl transferase superfamily protein [Burkholderiaceae bacterium]|jgi:4'-phosphopantetheinyl transferase|nr:4'-phosphopantetheinyl transferase superfamily protein [Burkholderiaceae bacterium]
MWQRETYPEAELLAQIAKKIETPCASIWIAHTGVLEEVAGLSPLLDSREISRSLSFARSARRKQFLLGRILLKLAIADLLEFPPQQIDISERGVLVPRIPSRYHLPGLCLSHSGERVACTVSRDTVLGLDIETRDDTRDISGISRLAFHAEERTYVETRTGRDRISAFYAVWTRKEALYKLAFSQGGEKQARISWEQNSLNAETSYDCFHLENCRENWSIAVCALPGEKSLPV